MSELERPAWLWEGDFDVYHLGCEMSTLGGYTVVKSVVEYQGKNYRIPACAHPEYFGWMKLRVTRRQTSVGKVLSFKGICDE